MEEYPIFEIYDSQSEASEQYPNDRDNRPIREPKANAYYSDNKKDSFNSYTEEGWWSSPALSGI